MLPAEAGEGSLSQQRFYGFTRGKMRFLFLLLSMSSPSLPGVDILVAPAIVSCDMIVAIILKVGEKTLAERRWPALEAASYRL